MGSMFKADCSRSDYLPSVASQHQNKARRLERRRFTLSTRQGCLLLTAFVFCLLGVCSAHATTYYLSPSGNDGNTGLNTGTSWLSPNHKVNCGDVIVAAAGNYSAAEFYTGKWGTVNCPAGNNVAWLKCGTFDTCKISTGQNQGMWVDQSYWGVQGWEVTTSASDTYGTCFIAQPNWNTPVEIHHIIFANDIANGCSQGGFTANNHGYAGVDYLAILGSIAYNAAQGSGSCASGISIYQPRQSDTATGTHLYVAGNFSYSNIDPRTCNGGSSTDGEGIIFDAFDGSQNGLSPYWSQAVAQNNLVFNNGSKGLEVNNNSAGSYHASIWLNQNTSYGNLTDPNQSWIGCAELSLAVGSSTKMYNNLVSTKSATACGGHAIYAVAIMGGDGSDQVVDNFAYGFSGNNTFEYADGSFSYGSTNTLGVSPSFTNPVVPGAPNCNGKGSVPSCMSGVIADFVPQTSSAKAFGYHTPSSGSVSDVLFPHWLCTANVPAGLVTMGCS
jgi:hypothetical protein